MNFTCVWTGVCAAVLFTSAGTAQQAVSGQVFNLPKDYLVTIRLQSVGGPNFYETKTRPDGSWMVRSVARNNYTIAAIRRGGSTLGICFQPASQMVSVDNRDVTGVNFRAEWPRETCPTSGIRAVSGVVLGLRGEERATILA